MTGVQTCALPICFPVTIRGNKNYSLVTSKTVKDAVIKTSTSKSFNKDTGRKQREVFTYTDAMKVNDEKIEEKRTKLLDVLGLKKEGVKKEDLERSLWKKCDELTQSKKDADKKKFAKIMSIFKDISKLLSKEDIADLSIFARAAIKRYNANVDSSKQVILRNEAKRLREEEKMVKKNLKVDIMIRLNKDIHILMNFVICRVYPPWRMEIMILYLIF